MNENDSKFIEALKDELELEVKQVSTNDCLFVDNLRTVFYEKLKAENCMDKAFIKAVWIAFLKGIEIGSKKGAEAP